MINWLLKLAADDIDLDAVARFDLGGQTYKIDRSPADKFHPTDDLCTSLSMSHKI